MAAGALTKGEKRLIVAVCAFVLLIGGAAYWWNWMNAIPAIAVPKPPPLPSPNAKDYFEQAYNVLFYSSNLPASRTGAKITIEHAERFDRFRFTPPPAPGSPPNYSWDTPPPGATLDDFRVFVTKNAKTFALIRQGLAYDYGEMAPRSFNALFPHLAHLRRLARCLAAAGNVAALDGDWTGATAYYLDGIALGKKTQQANSVIGLLVSLALENITRRNAWTVVDHLDVTTARNATRRMEALTNPTIDFATILQEEKWAGQASYLELMCKPGWQEVLVDEMGCVDRTLQLKLYLRTISKRAIIENYTRYMDACIVNAKLPYTALKTKPAIPHDLFNRMLCHDFDSEHLKLVYSETQDALLLVSFALRAYRLEHGSYPATLTALVPGYLNAVPNDPFAYKGSLGYARKGSSYILYSVGPDSQDNGGTPSADGRIPIRLNGVKFYTSTNPCNSNSTGDIVAGVNIR